MAQMHEPLPLPHTVAAGEIAPVRRHVLHRDYETRSKAVLKVVGPHRYAADPSTEVVWVAFAVGDQPVQLVRPGDGVPPEYLAAAQEDWDAAAHNDSFETAVERHILKPRFDWPLIPIERHRCTLAMALALGLPARLDRLADALELANRKDKAGERLMHLMSKPRRPHKDEDPSGIYWFDDPERLRRWGE
jgi:DNA polymerase